jgi:hypothetical protein
MKKIQLVCEEKPLLELIATQVERFSSRAVFC